MELKNTYKSKITEIRLPPDLYFASIDNHTNQTDTLSKTIHTRFVQFYFCTKGSVTFHFGNDYHRVLEEGNSFLIYQPARDLPIQLSLSGGSKIQIVVMSVLELHALFGSEVFQDFISDTKKQVYETQSIHSNLQFVLGQLEQVSIPESLHDRYWKTKISELLLLYFSQKLEVENSCPFLEHESVALKVKSAKEHLINHLSHPPKIEDLADAVGLSEYKLKVGFKTIYGQSISKFVLQHRMQTAKEEIEKRNKKIKDIALEIGYENPSHFIDAYKKQYGITPKQYEKSLG